MKNNWWNFLNDADLQWTETTRLIMMIIPFVGLFLIFMFRRPLSRMPERIKRILFGTLGGLILTIELTQDITKIVANTNGGMEAGEAIKEQVLEMLELCRLNTILLGSFLLFNKIHWIKWIAGTTLFGGFSTVYDHWGHGGPNATAAVWGVLKHGVVLTLVPALSIASHSEKFTMKNLGFAHIFNYCYVALVILLNYLVADGSGNYTRSIGNLNELKLAKNALVGWAPFGLRIIMYVLCVTVIFWIWWAVENFIHRHTNYARKNNYLVLLAPKQISTTLTSAGVVTVEWVQIKYSNSISWITKWSTRIGITMKQTWNRFSIWTKAKASAFGQWTVKTAKNFPSWSLGVIKGTPSWIARNSAILFTIFLSALFITLVAFGLKASFNGNYDGVTPQWQGKNDPTWKTIDGGYLATFVISLIAGALSIFALGGWLRGSAWINKSNTYVKGTVYVRTKTQNIVFRVLTIMIALVMLASFCMTVFYEDLGKMISKKNAERGGDASYSVLSSTWDYILSPVRWYYQCFISSLLMGFSLVFKKYKWVKYLLPLAFIGAFRTFIDVTDWADGGSWTNIGFLRLTFVHVMIVAGPLFVMISNRYRYSLKDIKISAIYTFVMVFIPYMIYQMHDQGKTLNGVANAKFYDSGWGELTGVGEILKVSKTWIIEHPHMMFWLVVVPFGLLLFLVFIFIYNFFYFKAQAKGHFGKRWLSMWKPWFKEVTGMQWTELKTSFSFFNRADKPARVRKTVFGIAPAKGKVSEDPYVNIKSK